MQNDSKAEDTASSLRPNRDRQVSLSVQSKMRSDSFRKSATLQDPLSPNAAGSRSPELPTLAPDTDSVNTIYRKQAARLNELEKENRRLAKEAQENEHRWKQAEEELEELREASGDVAELKLKSEKAASLADELGKVKTEITSLQRQNSQLQSQSMKRHVSSPSQPVTADGSVASLQTQIDSRNSTIESMEMEISNLRTQLDKSAQSIGSHTEQVSALEEKLERAERAAASAQRELSDVKRSLDRASEKAVKDGTAKTSAETQIRALERKAEESKKLADETFKSIDNLEKKLVALTNMHKEADARRQTAEKQREVLEKEAGEMRRRLASLENENLRMRDERERARKRDAVGADDEAVDELEDEERRRLEAKVRGLETEVHELRKGIWRDRRREIGAAGGNEELNSPGSKFDDVDLTSGPSTFRRQSLAGRGSSFQDVITSGINAFTGGGANNNHDLLDGVDDDFDEDAFRLAQGEEATKRLERVKEIKRGLKEWEGWRMDIADLRVGGGGAGEIFDV